MSARACPLPDIRPVAQQSLLSRGWDTWLAPARTKASLVPVISLHQELLLPSRMQMLLHLSQLGSVSAIQRVGHVDVMPREAHLGTAAPLSPRPGGSSLMRCSGSLVARRPDGNK